MEFNNIIYKKDTKGKIRYLQVHVLNDSLNQISGIVSTINPIVHSKTCKPKNVGRSNETSANDQAIKEAEALIKDKLTKGYFETIKEAEEEEVILPMLAKSYKDEAHKIKLGHDVIYTQPKLDGMRCLAHINSLTDIRLKSRDGKPISNMMHIETDLMKLATRLNPGGFPHIIDGELYVHGEDFQSNMEAIKKYRKGITEKVQLHIYDKINVGEKFEFRKAGLSYISELSKGLNLTSLDFIYSMEISSLEELKSAHTAYLAAGYEGTMIRTGEGLYKVNGRSSDLLKYKDFIDIDCKIVEIGPCTDRPEWARPVVEWNGVRFSCGTKMSHDARKEMLTNKDEYIDKIANIRYFELSNTGIPRFPVMVGVHMDR